MSKIGFDKTVFGADLTRRVACFEDYHWLLRKMEQGWGINLIF